MSVARRLRIAPIKLRGQLQPIVLDSDGRILDGRNRFAACKLADVEPKFSTYEGDDPDGYALAVNISRRHMTKGQQAIVVARAVFESNTELSRVEREMKAKQYGISPSRIAYALVILEFATDLADEVLAASALLDFFPTSPNALRSPCHGFLAVPPATYRTATESAERLAVLDEIAREHRLAQQLAAL